MHEDVTVAMANRSLIARDYHTVVEAENRAATCESWAMLLENVVWQRWAVTRLTFTLLNVEEASGRRNFSEQLLHLLAALFKQIPDEKGAEDIHQHVRDIPRGNRNKGVSCVSLFNACLLSGVVETRCERYGGLGV